MIMRIDQSSQFAYVILRLRCLSFRKTFDLLRPIVCYQDIDPFTLTHIDKLFNVLWLRCLLGPVTHAEVCYHHFFDFSDSILPKEMKVGC